MSLIDWMMDNIFLTIAIIGIILAIIFFILIYLGRYKPAKPHWYSL